MADNLKTFYLPALVGVSTVVNIVSQPAAGKTRRVKVKIINKDTAAQTCYLAKSNANNDVTDKGIIPPAYSIAAGDYVIEDAVLENGQYINFQATNANKFVVSAEGVESDVQ